MRNRCRMSFPRAGMKNLFNLREGKVAFLLAIVEVWRDTHAGVGTLVHDDVAREEFATNFMSGRAFDGNRPCPLRGIFGGVHMPAARAGAFDEAGGHAHRFVADRRYANLVENLQPRLARVERWNMRRAVQIAEGIFAWLDRACFEGKWAAMRDPAGQRRAELGAQIFANVQVCHSRSATEPLENSPDGKINTESAHVDRNRARSLENIENHMRADSMRPCDNGAGFDDAGTAEKNLPDRNKQGRFVDGRERI